MLGDAKLPKDYAQAIGEHETDGLGVSIISCWEVAKLIEFGRLVLPTTLDEWSKHLRMAVLGYGAYFEAFYPP